MKFFKPNGSLIPIGGRKDKRLKKTWRKKHPELCVITSDTELPREVAQEA